MSITVPPMPSQDAAAPVFAQLAEFSRGATSQAPSRPASRKPRILLGASIILSSIGILMLVCVVAVLCAPQSSLSQLVVLASSALF